MSAQTPVMAGLAGFLLARITEDEADAESEHVLGCDHYAEPFGRDVCTCGAVKPTYRWNPGRIRAECEAKRRIVGLHEPWAYACAGCDSLEICPTLQALALPYADHPDYRQEWTV